MNRCPKYTEPVSAADEPTESRVRRDLRDALRQAKKFSRGDISSGDWFPKLLKIALASGAKHATLEGFHRQYPGLTDDQIVEERIARAKRYAAVKAVVSSTVYSAAVGAAIGSFGSGMLIGVPIAVTAFLADTLVATRLKVGLAHEIGVVYGHQFNFKDSEDVYDLLRIAFGKKAGAVARDETAGEMPSAKESGWLAFAKGTAKAWAKALPKVGKFLLRRQALKFMVPVISVPVNAGLSYRATGAAAERAQVIFRNKASIRAWVTRLVDRIKDKELLLDVIWLVVVSHEGATPEEAWLVTSVSDAVRAAPGGKEVVEAFEAAGRIDSSEVVAALRKADPDERAALYQAACFAATVDADLAPSERPVLLHLAEVTGQRYDRTQLERMARRWA